MDTKNTNRKNKTTEVKQLGFKTNYNAQHFPTRAEVNTGVSQTTPDESLTPRQLLENHVRGIPNPTMTTQSPQGIEVPTMEDFTDLQDKGHELTQQKAQLDLEIEAERAQADAQRKQQTLTTEGSNDNYPPKASEAQD